MLHAGVLMKLGGYGCFRIAMYLMPEGLAQWGDFFLILTTVSVVYGAFSAVVQTDLKYINAYSSVSHCGLVLFALLMAVSLFGYSYFNYQQTASSQPQMAGMKFMMVYMMPIMMLLWFNSYSSGLCYYYLLSNLFTIGQTLLIRRMVDDDKIHAVMQANAAKRSKGKKSKFQQRYEELLRQQEAQQRTKRK